MPGQRQKAPLCVVCDFTSIVVLDITAGSFHRGVTASAPPAQLAHTVPAIVTQSAPTISIAQTRAALCVTKWTKTKVGNENQIAVTHGHCTLFMGKENYKFEKNDKNVR